ncbi:NAC domain-containing protein JA2L-like [Dioscorea cayenensis subsp. rotundata]|uniref:NAC domain-containing protein JA2L-like n=1 Tax=Dioscorea cayennensis subsp. rotundata TaxID=55577 RepID=A0AB40CPR0_DIOCR|nr:NAC domain-containing protein JA2L-like [Dioscorea cayenensis subsp. rotundata]
MHEFRLENPLTLPKEDWVLCRVFKKKKGDESHASTSADEQAMQEYNNNNISEKMSTSLIYIPDEQEEDMYNKESSSNSILNLAMFQCCHFLDEVDYSTSIGMRMINSRTDHGDDVDDYGLLLDVGLINNSIGM